MDNIEKDIKTLRSAERRTAYLSSIIAIPLLVMGLSMINDGEYLLGLLISMGGCLHIFIFKSTFSRKSKVRILNEGVSVGEKFIKWYEISKIYIRAEKETINFIPTSEGKHISLVSDFGKIVDLNFGVFGRMGTKTLNAYNRVYQFIIEKTMERQWNIFVDSLKRGELLDFNLLAIQADGILLKKYKKGKQLLKIDKIKDHHFSDGALYMIYIDEKGKNAKCKIGEVALIPNIHIIQYFLDKVIKVK